LLLYLDHSNPSDFEEEVDEEENEQVGDNLGGALPQEQQIAMGVGPSNLANTVRSALPLPRTHKMLFVANMELKMG